MISVAPVLASPLRPAFRDGQTLRAADLRAEADDRIEAARAHQAHAHTPGVIAGLWLVYGNARVSVTPGAAIDPDGRTILVPESRSIAVPVGVPFDVWLEFRLSPDDADADSPDRIVEECDVFAASFGELPRTDPDIAPVFLGSVVDGKLDYSRRAYVGAVGARIESASRSVRIALGPTGPDDPRVFAVGTRAADGRDFRDVLAADSAGSVTLSAPADVANGGRCVPVIVGARPPEFFAGDILDPVGVARLANAILKTVPNGPIDFETDGDGRLRDILAGAFNAALAAGPDTTDDFIAAVRSTGAVLRDCTRDLLQARAAEPDRVDEAELRRDLLDDAFAGMVARLPDAGAIRGVSFNGVAAIAPARPGCVSLVDTTDKAGPARELRFSFFDPGNEQHPERYRAVIGTVENRAAGPAVFAGCLTVDAGKVVIVAGDLKVFGADGTTEGLILRIAPPVDPNDPAAIAAQVGLVGPNDLLIHGDPISEVTATAVRLKTEAQLLNKGKAAMVGVRLDATLFPKNDTTPEPINVALLERLALEPGQACAFVSPAGDGKTALEIPLAAPGGSDFTDKAKYPVLTLILKAIGAGPGNVLAECARRFDFKNE